MKVEIVFLKLVNFKFSGKKRLISVHNRTISNLQTPGRFKFNSNFTHSIRTTSEKNGFQINFI